MDKDRIRQLAESAQIRGSECHGKFVAATANRNSKVAASHLNDAFYWFGHANAYKGILAGLEIQEGIDAEKDAEDSCP